MAVGDLYKLEMRQEYAGMAQSISFFFSQIGNNAAGDDPAYDLTLCALDVAAGVAKFLTAFTVDSAKFACVVARKVLDLSGTGADDAVEFGADVVGTLTDGLPPAQTMVIQQQGVAGGLAKNPVRVSYLGGLSEDLVLGYAFEQIVQTKFQLGISPLLLPKTNGDSTPRWQMHVPIRGPAPTYTITGSAAVSCVPTPLFPSVMKSRQGYLCG